MHTNKCIAIALASLCAAWAAGATETGAAPEATPFLRIDVPVELQLDVVTDPDTAELSDLNATIESNLTVNVADFLLLEFGMTFEPVDDPTGDRAFEGQGLYVNAIGVVGSFGPLTLHAGKFTPNFSIGFEYAPGLNGGRTSADAEIAERIGVAAAYNFVSEGTAGGVIVSGALFRRDTTALSDSIFTRRGQLHVSQAGPGNHDGLQSFAVAFDMLELDCLPGVHLHAAYLRQRAGEGDPADQHAWVVAGNWSIDAGEQSKYQLLLEWARSEDALDFDDATSNPDAAQDLVIAGLGGTWNDSWTGSIVYRLRSSNDPVGGDSDDSSVQVTAGYFIDEDLSIEVGWQSYDDGMDTVQAFGLRLASDWEYVVE